MGDSQSVRAEDEAQRFPPSTSSNSNWSHEDKLTSDGQLTLSLMEAALNVSFAGFGGALAGLSMSRRGGTTGAAQAVTRTMRQASGRNGVSSARATNPKSRLVERNSAYMDNDLPVTWAVSCMTFATVLECCKRSSPTSQLFHNLNNVSIENVGRRFSMDHDLYIVGDYGIGGAVAGAIFKGSMIQSANKNNTRRPVNPKILAANKQQAKISSGLSGGVLRGLYTGGSMGLLAGVMVYGLMKVGKSLEGKSNQRVPFRAQPEGRDQDVNGNFNRTRNNDEDIAVVLSSEELQNIISELEVLVDDPPQGKGPPQNTS